MANWLKLKGDDKESQEQRALLARILESQAFHKSTRSKQLLEFLGKHYFEDQNETLHEARIGTELFGRGENFDPAEDSIVRSSMRQLRARLAEYYATEGAQEVWEVQIPKGSYRTVFQLRELSIVEPEPAPSPEPEATGNRPPTPATDGGAPNQ